MMENDHRHPHGSGFLNGFVLGLLVGAGLVFLFGTAKGKKVLQMLLEQVEENTQLSELLEMPEDESEEEFLMGEELDESGPEAHQPLAEEEKHAEHAHAEESKPHKTVAKVKRFFRGSPKKLVS